MKILLSPAKEMNLSHTLTEDWQLPSASKAVVEALENLSADELRRKMKLTAPQVEEVRSHISQFHQPPTYPAWRMYNGLAFRWMWKQLGEVNTAQESYAHEHLRILSALYGPISPLTPVKPYRLDFTTSLPIHGSSLKQHWRTNYPRAFEPNELIFNAASHEFSSLLTPSDYRWVNLDFYEKSGDTVKRHSTISKKARGQFVAHLINQQITTIEAAQSFNADGYHYVEEDSTNTLLTFARHV